MAKKEIDSLREFTDRGEMAEIFGRDTSGEYGHFPASNIVTTEELTAALATKAALMPHSLAEQPVPGEFWIGNDNVLRQVYVRTFAGNFAGATGEVVLANGARECKVDNGGMYNPSIPAFSIPSQYGINASNAYQFNIALWEGTLSILYDTTSAQFPVSTFAITIKYTKA